MCVCIALCTIVAHNIAQNRPDSFPPYPPDNHHCSDDVYLREGGTHFQKVGPLGQTDARLTASFPGQPGWLGLMKQETMGWRWFQLDHTQMVGWLEFIRPF